jgi:hypothetical protein
LSLGRIVGGKRSEESEAKQREVLQLLRDYRAWHSAYGGAISLDEAANMTDTTYGPAGMVTTGAEFEPHDRKLLAESYEHLRHALTLLQNDGPLGMAAWSVLLTPYLGDPADPSIVAEWRKKRPNLAEWHDRAVSQLAWYLRKVDLHYVPPKIMSEQEEAAVEKQNASMYAVFQRLRVSGLKEDAALEQTAENFGVPSDYVRRVLEFRGDTKLATCAEGGCDRSVYQQNLCQRHYQRAWRARKRRAS